MRPSKRRWGSLGKDRKQPFFQNPSIVSTLFRRKITPQKCSIQPLLHNSSSLLKTQCSKLCIPTSIKWKTWNWALVNTQLTNLSSYDKKRVTRPLMRLKGLGTMKSPWANVNRIKRQFTCQIEPKTSSHYSLDLTVLGSQRLIGWRNQSHFWTIHKKSWLTIGSTIEWPIHPRIRGMLLRTWSILSFSNCHRSIKLYTVIRVRTKIKRIVWKEALI